MPRGKKREVSTNAAQGRQRTTRSTKKQKTEVEAVGENEHTSKIDNRTSQQDQQLRAVIQETGWSLQGKLKPTSGLNNHNVSSRFTQSGGNGYAAEDGNNSKPRLLQYGSLCHIQVIPECLESQDAPVIDMDRDSGFRHITRRSQLRSPFKEGDIYITLVSRDGKHTYRLHSTVLAHVSPWFRYTFAVAPAEVDPTLHEEILENTGLHARYGLIHDDHFDIPILKRMSFTIYKDEIPPREIGKEVQNIPASDYSSNIPPQSPMSRKFTDMLSEVLTPITIEEHNKTSDIKQSPTASVQEPRWSKNQNTILDTPAMRNQHASDKYIYGLDGAMDYPSEIYQDTQDAKVEEETTPQNSSTHIERTPQSFIDHKHTTSLDIKAEEENVEESKMHNHDDSGSVKLRAEEHETLHVLSKDIALVQSCDAHPDASQHTPLVDQTVQTPSTQLIGDFSELLSTSQRLQEQQSVDVDLSFKVVPASQPRELQPSFRPENLADVQPAENTQVKEEEDTAVTFVQQDSTVLESIADIQPTENTQVKEEEDNAVPSTQQDSTVPQSIEAQVLTAVAPVVSSPDVLKTVENKLEDLPGEKPQEEIEETLFTPGQQVIPPFEQHFGDNSMDVPTINSETVTLSSLPSPHNEIDCVPTSLSRGKPEEEFNQASPKIDPAAEAAGELLSKEQVIEPSQMNIDAPTTSSTEVHNTEVVPELGSPAIQATLPPYSASLAENALLPSGGPPSESAVEIQLTTPPQSPTKARFVAKEVQQAPIIKQTLVVEPAVLDAYHFLFQTYYNIPPALSTTDLHQAVDQAGLLVRVAELYQSLPIVRPHICCSLLSHGQELHSAILQNPPHFLLLSIKLHCAPIFKEAIIHIVGQAPLWPWPVARDVIPAKVLRLLETKSVEFKAAKNIVNTELFTSCLAKGNSRITISMVEPGTLDTWVVVQMWHEWFCGAVRECNIVRESQGKIIEGNMYRLMARGGDSYLEIEDVLRTLRRYKTPEGSSEWGNWKRKEVEEDLRMMKEYAAKAVKTLVVNRAMIHVMGGEDEKEMGHLTCVKVEENELPWVEVIDIDE